MSPEDFDRLRKQRAIADEIERQLRYDYSHALIDDYGKLVDSLKKCSIISIAFAEPFKVFSKMPVGSSIGSLILEKLP